MPAPGLQVDPVDPASRRSVRRFVDVPFLVYGRKSAFFECQEGDDEAARALLDRLFEWAGQRGLTQVVGPRGLSAFDGYGLLIHGFDRRQLMTMTNYNPPWYQRVIEGLGFEKEVDRRSV